MSPAETIAAIVARFPDEETAERYFQEKRWPGGVVTCPSCGSSDVLRGVTTRKRQLWYCHDKTCGHHFSVTSGTEFGCSKFALRQLAIARELTLAGRTGAECARAIGATYPSTHKLHSRICAAEKIQKPLHHKGSAKATSWHKTGIVTFVVFGQTMSVAEMAELAKVSKKAIFHRIGRGLTPEEAVLYGERAVPRKAKRAGRPV